MRRVGWFAALGLCVGLFLPGCAPSPPPFVEAGGKVLLNGQPLPNAVVQFVPEIEHFGAEMNSTGTTDEKGEFKLTCPTRNVDGAAVATHRVLVFEVVPADMRGMDEKSQEKAAKHQASLKNRPIPPKYATFSLTPVRVTVEAGKTSYLVDLKR
jgi:hypothetical protein